MSAAYIPSQLSELTGTITTSAISDFAEGVDDRVNALPRRRDRDHVDLQ